MVTDSNSQINTFIRGMNTDASYQMIQEGQYTDANNIRVTSLTQGNTDKTNSYGEVRPIEGIDIVHTINDKVDNILATGYIRNLGVIIYKTSSIGLIDPIHPRTFEQWKVYVYNMETNDGKINFVSPKEEVKFHSTIPRKFSITLRYEDEDNIKLYIADGIHPIMVLNIAKDNTQINIDQIQSYPAIRFTKPIFCGLIPGRLKAGLVQYSYRLYNKNGVATDVSPTTRLIPVVSSSSAINNNGILEFPVGKDINGLNQEETSNVGVKLKLKIDSQYDYLDRILVYRITYVQNGQLPIIELISDREIEADKDGFMYAYDTGQNALQVLTLEEYNAMSGIHIIPKVIESKNDYLFAANIKDELSTFDVDWEASEDTVDYEVVTTTIDTDVADKEDFDGELITSNRISFGEESKEVSNIFSIKDSEDTINASDYFEPYRGTGTYADPQMAYYLRSLRRDETYRYGIVFYNKRGLASPVKWIADITTDPIYKQTQQHNDDLNPSFTFNNSTGLQVHPLGVKFTIKNIPSEAVSYEIVRCNRNIEDIKNLMQGVVARPIRRIHKQDVTEGVDDQGNPIVVDNVNMTYPYTPTGFLTTADFFAGDFEQEDNDLGAKTSGYNMFQFVSPEISYQKDYIDTMLKHRNIKAEKLLYLYSCADESYNTGKVPINVGPLVVGGPKYTIIYPGISNTNIPIIAQENVATSVYLETKLIPTTFYMIKHDGNNTDYGYTTPTGDEQTFTKLEDWPTIKRGSYSYLKLYISTNHMSYEDESNYKITDYKIPDNLNWDQVYATQSTTDKTTFTKKYQDYVTAINTGLYCNVVMFDNYDKEVQNVINKDDVSDLSKDGDANHMTGLGGPCMIFSTQGNAFLPVNLSVHKETIDDVQTDVIDGNPCVMFGTYLCNIQQTNIVPYGGDSDEAKSTNIYYSYGDFFNLEENKTESTCYVFDGDCFIMPFEYVSMHKYYTPLDKGTGVSHSIIYSIPVETNINLAYTSGNEFSRHYKDVGITNLQIEPSAVYNAFVQKDPLYVYNSAYSTQDKTRLFAAENEQQQDIVDMNTDYRVYHSLLKTNDERIDSWTKFMPADYIDVDTRYGEVTELRTFHNKLIFWQKDAMGMLSVNERSTVTDNSNMPLILGTSGVLSRYDYIDETAGMMPEQYVDTYSNTTLYWYDAAHKEIKSYNEGSTVTQLSKAKSVQNKLNKSINNDPYIMFDNKYNTVIADVLDNKNIMYDETLQQFVSTTDVVIQGSMKHDEDIYVVNRNKIALLDHPTDTNEYVDWDGNKLSTYLEYVVNKSPLTTKVFDNQEIVTVNNPVEYNLESPHEDRQSYYTRNHNYTWTTDLNTTSTDNLETTLREGNYRYSIPRHGNEEYGNRMRGKYMICSITDTDPHTDSSLSYIITKFRTSWS